MNEFGATTPIFWLSPMPIKGRDKGHSFERWICSKLKSIFPRIATSRSESRKADDELRDFVNTEPWGIQAKAVERNVNYWQLLQDMREKDSTVGREFYAVIHKKNRRGTVVVMTFEDFQKILMKSFDWRDVMLHADQTQIKIQK